MKNESDEIEACRKWVRLSNRFAVTPDDYAKLIDRALVALAREPALREKVRDNGFATGIKAAADYVGQFNSVTRHEYRLDDCVLGKFNVTKRKRPRRNKFNPSVRTGGWL
jgi:hypothetical protein